MNTIATSVEQSKELLELGIDPNTASMFWTHLKIKDEAGNMKSASVLHVLESRGVSLFEDLKAFQRDFVSFTPAWTLGNLIEFLPDEITKDGQKYTLSIGKDEISYIYINTQRIVSVACLYNFEGNLIDAAVEAIKAVKKLMSCATLAHDLGYSLENIAQMNIEKLQSRKARGVIGGSGDNR